MTFLRVQITTSTTKQWSGYRSTLFRASRPWADSNWKKLTFSLGNCFFEELRIFKYPRFVNQPENWTHQKTKDIILGSHSKFTFTKSIQILSVTSTNEYITMYEVNAPCGRKTDFYREMWTHYIVRPKMCHVPSLSFVFGIVWQSSNVPFSSCTESQFIVFKCAVRC